MKRMKKMAAFVMAFVLSACFSLTVCASADTNVAVNEAKNGVLQVNVYYVDQNGEYHGLVSGSGFLIGETSGAEYLITNAHVVVMEAMDYDAKAAWSEEFGVDFFKSAGINLRIQVVVKRDVVITATLVNGSVEMDFAILKLEQPIYDRAPLTINDDTSQVLSTNNVYALGFPGIIEEIQDTQYYTSDDVNVTNGIISKLHTIDSVLYVQHNATITGGNSGGPLLNSRGAVIGVNRGSVVDTYFYSVHISEVTEVLDALGIHYIVDNDQTSEPTPTPESVPTPVTDGGETNEDVMPVNAVNKSELSTAVANASNMNTSGYSDESVLDLTAAIGEANAIINSTTVSQTDVDMALYNLERARDSLVTKGGLSTNVIIIILIVAVLLVIIIVVIAVMLGKKGKGKETAPRQTYPNGMPGGMPVSPTPLQSQPFNPFMSSEGAGETSVLDAGAGETSVLNAGSAMASASITRSKNRESIAITKQVFKIGKERSKVDYCIPDNSSISRHHGSIIFKGGAYYLVDMKSTNFSFVNGNKVGPGQEIKLNSGDKIKFSDEEFEFRC